MVVVWGLVGGVGGGVVWLGGVCGRCVVWWRSVGVLCDVGLSFFFWLFFFCFFVFSFLFDISIVVIKPHRGVLPPSLCLQAGRA